MTEITDLINAASEHLPFPTRIAAQTFLDQYNQSDQCALISAMYIGRDHIHGNAITQEYVPQSIPFDRFFTTGDSSRWLIPPANFANILYEKNINVEKYFDAFLNAVMTSEYSLIDF